MCVLFFSSNLVALVRPELVEALRQNDLRQRLSPSRPIYLFSKQAAQFEGVLPPLCVAVEDSASGVGSAEAASMGMIVGYVGASHITDVSAF